jgi:endonuclease G, mitochondrial
MAEQGFGKFKSVEEFLESFERARRQEQEHGVEESLGLEGRQRRRRRPPRQPRPREVAEVIGVLRAREADDTSPPKHHHLLLTVEEIVDATVNVEGDVTRVMGAAEDVFVSVRFGDRMGITETIGGMVAGARLHVRGEWITRQLAHDHGGRDLSVLHFTHDPLGFICVGDPEQCFA